MSQPQSAVPIADLMEQLKQGVGLELDAMGMAEMLWLALQIQPIGEGISSEPEAEVDSDSDSVDGTEVIDSTPATPISEPERTGQPKAAVVTSPSASEQPEGLPIKIPAASALPNAVQLGRSLRPLKRKVPSRTQQIMDDEATAVRIADERIWSPVMQPAPERWLEVAIVVEETGLLEIWRDTIAEFEQLVERHGAFRDVRTWQLVTRIEGVSQPKIELFRRKTANVDRSRSRRPQELLDPSGRRLILLVSDCTSTAWRQGILPDLLQEWMGHNPVAIVQLLPAAYWQRSVLRLGYPVWLYANSPGTLNHRLRVEGLRPQQAAQLQNGLTLPIVTLEALPLLQWAKVVAGSTAQETAGVILDRGWLQEAAEEASEQAASGIEPLTALQLVRRFRGTASPIARQLAGRMAAVPVSQSVIRLIQKTLLPEVEPVHVAEVFLSGLLHGNPVSPPTSSSGNLAKDSSPVRYEFVEGVRELLLSTMLISETEEVLEEVAEAVLSQLPQQIRDQLSEEIERRLGESLHSFDAFLLPDVLADLPLDKALQAELLPFATITRQVLQQMGGEYADWAERLQQMDGWEEPHTAELEQETDFPTFPPLEEMEFEVVMVDVTEEPPPQPLQRFTFQIATVEIQAPGLLRRQPKVVIRERSGQAEGHTELLSDRVSLEMVAIPGGRFQMGSPEGELDRFESEGPKHEVTVPPFFMGKYPVTQVQWQLVASLPKVEQDLDPSPSKFKGDHRPVEQVSWHDAVEFCQRLAQHTGRPYRLPSEAEWEYACRAGTTTPFHFGETITPALANYNWSSTYGQAPSENQGSQGTTPVGQFKFANAFGLYDMHGNVWEWCEDHWHSSYKGAPIDGSAWIDPNAERDRRRVLRGGSWLDYPRFCRSAYRVSTDAGIRGGNGGFRVVCSAPRALR